MYFRNIAHPNQFAIAVFTGKRAEGPRGRGESFALHSIGGFFALTCAPKPKPLGVAQVLGKEPEESKESRIQNARTEGDVRRPLAVRSCFPARLPIRLDSLDSFSLDPEIGERNMLTSLGWQLHQ